MAANRSETLRPTEPFDPTDLRPEHNEYLHSHEGGREGKKKRLAEVRALYPENSVAQQKIDVYDEDSEYRKKIKEIVEAIRKGNTTREAELEAWFGEHYPNIPLDQ